MGHAGAIVGGAEDTAQAKMQIMRKCGIVVCESPAEIGITMVRLLSKKNMPKRIKTAQKRTAVKKTKPAKKSKVLKIKTPKKGQIKKTLSRSLTKKKPSVKGKAIVKASKQKPVLKSRSKSLKSVKKK